MKKVLLLSLTLILISGCSSELSPQEKRNEFDACVIEETVKENTRLEKLHGKEFISRPENQRIIEEEVENYCVKFLK